MPRTEAGKRWMQTPAAQVVTGMADAIDAIEDEASDAAWAESSIGVEGEIAEAVAAERERITREVSLGGPAMTEPLRDWWDSLSELDQFNAYRIEKSNADALALTREPGLDVERLARVLAQLGNPDDGWDDGIDAYAADIARTYAEDRP